MKLLDLLYLLYLVAADTAYLQSTSLLFSSCSELQFQLQVIILSFNFIFFLFSFLWHFSLQTFVQILKRFICGFCDHEQHSSILFSRLTSLLIFWCGIVLQHKNMKFESSRFHHLYRALVLFDILLFLSIVRFTSKPHLFILVTDYTIIEGRVFNCLHDTVLMMLSQFCFSQIKTYCTQLENYMCG